MRSWTDDDLKKALTSSVTLAEVCRKLGLVVTSGNYRTLKKHLVRLGLDTTHLQGTKTVHYRSGHNAHNKIALADILVKGSTYPGNRLKKRLWKEGLLPEKCSCGVGTEWRGKPLSLQLDHINGDHTDNRLENLRVLCPNCHSQTDTFSGRNKRGAAATTAELHRSVKPAL